MLYNYKCELVRVVDGDTVDVDIDLGFGTWLRNERVRLSGIDAPESRTSDLVEKIFGQAATAKVEDFFTEGPVILLSQDFKGKFGRILGDFVINGVKLTEMLLATHHAVPYEGTKTEREILHIENRKILVESGEVNL